MNEDRMSDHSAPPPSAATPGAKPAPREVVVPLDAAERSWRRAKRADDECMRLSAIGVEIEHGRVLRQPLRLGLGTISVGAVDPGPARARSHEGRFAVLRRLGPTAVVPQSEGIEGWLWTSTGGSGLTMLGEDDEAPNAAFVFAKPLSEDAVTRAFEPEFVTALAARSPLGVPTIHGLLFRVADSLLAERAFARFGLQRPLTDREVPPTLRRSLPTDRSADPIIRTGGHERAAARSIAPPGFS
jgi:hypothetical protein